MGKKGRNEAKFVILEARLGREVFLTFSPCRLQAVRFRSEFSLRFRKEGVVSVVPRTNRSMRARSGATKVRHSIVKRGLVPIPFHVVPLCSLSPFFLLFSTLELYIYVFWERAPTVLTK